MTYKVLYSPAEAIEDAKDNGTLKSVVFALISAAIMALSGVLVAGGNNSVMIFLNAFVVVAVAVIAFSALLQIFMGVVQSDWSFRSAITAISLTLFVKSIGLLLFALILSAPVGATLSLVIGVLLLAFVGVYACSILVKSGMEFYDVDLLTMIVAVVLIYASIFLAFYVAILGVSMTGRVQEIAGQAVQAVN